MDLERTLARYNRLKKLSLAQEERGLVATLTLFDKADEPIEITFIEVTSFKASEPIRCRDASPTYAIIDKTSHQVETGKYEIYDYEEGSISFYFNEYEVGAG